MGYAKDTKQKEIMIIYPDTWKDKKDAAYAKFLYNIVKLDASVATIN